MKKQDIKINETVLFLYWDDIPREGIFLGVNHLDSGPIAHCQGGGYMCKMPLDRVMPITQATTKKEKEEFVKNTISNYKAKEEK